MGVEEEEKKEILDDMAYLALRDSIPKNASILFSTNHEAQTVQIAFMQLASNPSNFVELA